MRARPGRQFNRKIPHGGIRSTVEYRSIPVNLASRWTDDPIVRLADHRISHDSYYARNDGLNPPYAHPIPGSTLVLRLRRRVVRLLQRVNKKLRPLGLELLVLDAHRSLACQKALWDHFFHQATLRFPHGSREHRERYTLRHCSDPRKFALDDPATWPTHLTGGAVDLTLRRIHGAREQLHMGSIFDESSSISATDYFERRVRSESDHEARTNRRILYWAMASQGFTNLASEWWHYDWGTQLWAATVRLMTGRTVSAFYGPVTSVRDRRQL